MFGRNERNVSIIDLEIFVAPFGMKCEIGINKIFMNTLSDEQQEEVTDILQNTFQKINKVIERKNEECCKGGK